MCACALKGLKILALPWYLWALHGPPKPTVKFAASHLVSSPSDGSAAPHLDLNWMDSTSLIASKIIQQANPILPQVTSTSCHYKACLSQPLLAHPVPKCVPHVVLPACSIFLPRLVHGCGYHLCTLGVVHLTVSNLLGPRVPLSPTRWMKGDQNSM